MRSVINKKFIFHLLLTKIIFLYKIFTKILMIALYLSILTISYVILLFIISINDQVLKIALKFLFQGTQNHILLISFDLVRI